jgi:hypothetical protein
MPFARFLIGPSGAQYNYKLKIVFLFFFIALLPKLPNPSPKKLPKKTFEIVKFIPIFA